VEFEVSCIARESCPNYLKGASYSVLASLVFFGPMSTFSGGGTDIDWNDIWNFFHFPILSVLISVNMLQLINEDVGNIDPTVDTYQSFTQSLATLCTNVYTQSGIC